MNAIATTLRNYSNTFTPRNSPPFLGGELRGGVVLTATPAPYLPQHYLYL